ncbi:MAG: hypothetical protein PVF32_10725 [Desulfobacterales bacterium]
MAVNSITALRSMGFLAVQARSNVQPSIMDAPTPMASRDGRSGLNFGEEMARHYPGGSIFFTMMMNCATIGDALDAFVR